MNVADSCSVQKKSRLDGLSELQDQVRKYEHQLLKVGLEVILYNFHRRLPCW